jgi:pilus assembly protein CpaB
MRLGRMLIIVALLLVVVLGLVFVLSNTLGGGNDLSEAEIQATEDASKQTVVTLSRSVEQGERLTLGKLTTTEIPQAQFTESMFTDPGQLVGLYVRTSYQVGTVITASMVVSDPTQLVNEMHSDHAALIPPGMVAFPIPINRFSGMAYGITTGDHVNVIATVAFVDLDTQFQTELPNYTAGILAPGQNVIFTSSSDHLDTGDNTNASSNTIFEHGDFWSNLVVQSYTGEFVAPQGRAELDALLDQPFYLVPGEANQRPRIVSQTILFNHLVLHVGNFALLDESGQTVQQPQAEQPAEGDQQAEGQQVTPTPVPEVIPPDIITLVVTPQEAVTLNYLLFSGAQLTLALRPPGDEAVIPTDAVTLQYLLDVYRIPVPVKLPYGFEPSIDILAPPVLENDNPNGSTGP